MAVGTTATDVRKVITEERRKNPAERLVSVYEGRLPRDIKDVFKITRALVVGNEIVAPVVTKMAETPITSVSIKSLTESKDEGSKEKLEDLFTNKLKIKSHLTGLSLDTYGYSNAFSSIYFAPVRYLVCERCERVARTMQKDLDKLRQQRKDAPEAEQEYYAKQIREYSQKIPDYRWLAKNLDWKYEITTDREKHENTLKFKGMCPSHHAEVVYRREDVQYKNAVRLRLIRWDPFYIDIRHYKGIGRNEYYYRFPDEEKRRIKNGDRIALTEYPWSYIKSAINNRLLHLNKKGLYHFKIESISGVYDGWGVPRVLSVLTALYSVMTMIKANEATSEGRINDLTIISPMRRGGQYQDDPIAAVGAENWINDVKKMLKDFKRDKTLVSLLPFPVEVESVFGQGRAQLITGELQIYIRNIVAALGLPEDVIYSGGNYTSIAVAARILANQAEVMRKEFNRYLNFIKDTASKMLRDVDFGGLTVELEPYESPDDFQKTNSMMQAAMAGQFPWGPIYKRFGLSTREAMKMMKDEAKQFAEINEIKAKSMGEQTAVSEALAQYFRLQFAQEMARGQQQMMQAQEPGGSQITPEDGAGQQQPKEQMAEYYANQIVQNYPPDSWGQLIQMLANQDPELAQLVQGLLEQQVPSSDSQTAQALAEGMPGMGSQNGNNSSMLQQIGEEQVMPDKQVPRSQQKL